jgi:hypothetical protein
VALSVYEPVAAWAQRGLDALRACVRGAAVLRVAAPRRLTVPTLLDLLEAPYLYAPDVGEGGDFG